MQLDPSDTSFQVEEIPAYAPSGKGEHLHLRIRKRNLSTPKLVQALAAAHQVPPRAIGYAGRKDRHGVTVQDFTVYRGEARHTTALPHHLPPGAEATVEHSTQHHNKIRIGHLKGNRFRLGISGVADPGTLAQALDKLTHSGITNAYGPQRYGLEQRNLTSAIAVGKGAMPAPRSPRQRQYLADAAQAAVFDAVLAGRQAAGLVHRLRPGDVAMLPSGACFVLSEEDTEDANQRLAQQALSTTGPLPGGKLLSASEAVTAEEQAWALSSGIDWAWLANGSPLASRGARRPLLVPFLEPPHVLPDPAHNDLHWLQFALPPGVYATTVLAQLHIDCQQRGSENG